MKFAYLIEPPFNYVDASGGVTGCDVELARYVFAEIGIADFEPVETEFAELLPGVADGRWRMTTGLFGTDERRKSALFSRPIWALPDGLLVAKGNPLGLSGYQSVADNSAVRLAVIRDQFQHRSAVEFGVSTDRIVIFETYTEAAQAVCEGSANAYASVGRAHSGFIEQNSEWGLELILVPNSEKPPAFGSFAFGLNDADLLNEVDAVLSQFLGTDAHRNMVASFGFSSEEVDMVAARHIES
ncbi:transporter substrate-binding domain-containing protein [Sulfitobacter pacificus]|uniref:Ectoine/hydroxyectoine ABC transporter substrate-binding protein EhuB n=1 Tax=Sulfitobacter pacificus TaxID=1499314 RepID=A0ABQ5VPR2_9RHOB|nr:transporter substrate-binding domain-containing protein [Sulfitobacter pacificus]GLQ28946.1 ectoine/hydroxyectoine ABC transporter substrate-binding protein EhuB [Sulfitobacter pacificus]